MDSPVEWLPLVGRDGWTSFVPVDTGLPPAVAWWTPLAGRDLEGLLALWTEMDAPAWYDVQ